MRRLRVLVPVLAEHPSGPRVLMVRDLVTGEWCLPGTEAPEGAALSEVGARALERSPPSCTARLSSPAAHWPGSGR
ncbi:hypothetical protein GCM10020256_51840 [Streptomyces thermocoprophilus]